MEAQVLLAGLQSKSTLPSFFESPIFRHFQQSDYVPPILDSQHSPDYNGSGSFPAFTYPRPLLPFCFPADTSRPLSVASGLDLYRSAQMIVRTLQSTMDDSNLVESKELYHLLEKVAPYLLYIHDFWMGRANCPLFAEQILLTAMSLSVRLPEFLRNGLDQQWGIPSEHRSSLSSTLISGHFPSIPIPFSLRFHEGNVMMRLAPSMDLDPFVSLRGQGSSVFASKVATPFAFF
ncbi:MAG: hypothetical protein NXY57DRAFT_969600 [Lentinula lateritia]|nr:MAG: hypothetical protein NXY57DRAFT_969600 [Lentinula lateritia]